MDEYGERPKFWAERLNANRVRGIIRMAPHHLGMPLHNQPFIARAEPLRVEPRRQVLAVSKGALELVGLPPLMARTSGSPAVRIGLIDGPVLHHHPALAGERIVEVAGGPPPTCSHASSRACMHGTLVAGVLLARRGSAAPAICPACTLLVRPIFDEMVEVGSEPQARAEDLIRAIEDVVRAGARIINISAALITANSTQIRQIDELLTDTARRGVIVVAAAGNQGTVASSAITHHRAVIPVVACELNGRPTPESNLSGRIGQAGLRAPGRQVTSLKADGSMSAFDGTSAAAALVTGAFALLYSEFPAATAQRIRDAVVGGPARRQRAIVPPLLNAYASFRRLAMN